MALGVPPASPNFAAPRYGAGDAADFPVDVNAVTDAFDAQAAKRGAIVDADIAAGAVIARSKLASLLIPSLFGDGSDGAVVLDGAVTVAWATKSGSVYTLTRDIHCTNLTVNGGVTLCAGGFRIHCTGTLTCAGTVHNDGPVAANGAVQGIGPGLFLLGPQVLRGYGGSGAASSRTYGSQGQQTGSGAPISLGGPGGAGGSGSGGVGGSALAAVPPVFGLPRALGQILLGLTMGSFGQMQPFGVGSGGSAGGGDNLTTTSGAGGNAGGVLHIAAAVIAGGGRISASGSAGLAATAVNAGGGGGGGGGGVLLVYGSNTFAGTIAAAGGAAGASGGGTGNPGSVGGAGNVLTYQV